MPWMQREDTWKQMNVCVQYWRFLVKEFSWISFTLMNGATTVKKSVDLWNNMTGLLLTIFS